MSSRFVPAGSAEASAPKDDDWDKARQQVENRRQTKAIESSKQDDGKSLYEVLQANKAAKQDAFEEASKLRNQFRPLDDSEIEFLDSVRESERAKEISLKQETAEQLELFRKQKAAAEQTAGADDTETGIGEQQPVQNLWTTSKKRRRDKASADIVPNKLRKSSAGEKSQDNEPATALPIVKQPPPDVNTETSAPSAENNKKVENQGSASLGLAAYDSGSDSD